MSLLYLLVRALSASSARLCLVCLCVLSVLIVSARVYSCLLGCRINCSSSLLLVSGTLSACCSSRDLEDRLGDCLGGLLRVLSQLILVVILSCGLGGLSRGTASEDCIGGLLRVSSCLLVL